MSLFLILFFVCLGKGNIKTFQKIQKQTSKQKLVTESIPTFFSIYCIGQEEGFVGHDIPPLHTPVLCFSLPTGSIYKGSLSDQSSRLNKRKTDVEPCTILVQLFFVLRETKVVKCY